MKCKFKIGNKVKIKKDFDIHKIGISGGVDKEKIYTIKNIREGQWGGLFKPINILLERTSYGWPEEAFELVTFEPKFKVGDKVTLKDNYNDLIVSIDNSVGYGLQKLGTFALHTDTMNCEIKKVQFRGDNIICKIKIKCKGCQDWIVYEEYVYEECLEPLTLEVAKLDEPNKNENLYNKAAFEPTFEPTFDRIQSMPTPTSPIFTMGWYRTDKVKTQLNPNLIEDLSIHLNQNN